MQPPTTPAEPAHKGRRILALLALSATGFLAMPFLLRWLNPGAGAFDLGVLNAPALAALQFFAAVSMAFAAWVLLFPRLFAYVRDCMEEKLFSTLTTDLLALLPTPLDDLQVLLPQQVQLAAERRHIAQFQFLIRCVRLLLSLLPFFVFLAAAVLMVNNALTIVPH